MASGVDRIPLRSWLLCRLGPRLCRFSCRDRYRDNATAPDRTTGRGPAIRGGTIDNPGIAGPSGRREVVVR